MTELSWERLEQLIDVRDVGTLDYGGLERLVRQEIASCLPDGVCAVDPRSDDRVVYNQARASRPHDNRPDQTTECIVCGGRMTRVVDVAELSQGFTFINKNLYPVLYPAQVPDVPPRNRSFGLHFLQWTSTRHDLDWHNMPASDLQIVVDRLAVLEQTLLTSSSEQMPDNRQWGDDTGTSGFMLTMKNFSHLVGGSIVHGHQQIGLTNTMPRRFLDNLRFEKREGEKYAVHILRENPADLRLVDYGPAVLLVPFFMRRPFDMQLVMKDPTKRYLFQLDPEERSAMARGWADAIRAIRQVMPAAGREAAYNVVTHTGPGAGIYFEFLPYSQETGGFEHLGLWVCQSSPLRAAGLLREIVGAGR